MLALLSVGVGGIGGGGGGGGKVVNEVVWWFRVWRCFCLLRVVAVAVTSHAR